MIELNKKYESLFNTDSRYIICLGGRGSSKSFSVATWLTLLISVESGHTILFTRYTLRSAGISIIPEFIDKIERLNLTSIFTITKDEIICLKTGSKILFRGLRTSSGLQTAQLKSLQGVTTWILDEAEELNDEEVFDKIDLSIRQVGIQNRVIMILNPTTKEHFIYKRFFEKKGVNSGINEIKGDTTYIHTTYLDNYDNLDSGFINQIETLKDENPDKFEHIVMGGWLDRLEGLCLPNWRFGEFDDTLEVGYGLDFGFSIDPTACSKVAIDKKQKLIYVKEVIHQTYLTTSEIYHLLKEEVGRREIIADNAEGRLIEELKRAGLNIKACVKGAGSIKEGIALMNDYTLIVSPESENIAKELRHYRWSDKGKEAPMDLWNHQIDGIRYRCSHILKRPGGLKMR